MGFVTPLQFFGIDLNPFAVELARVTLMIARKIAIDNFGILDQPALPLDSLDQNIVCADALFTDWPKADAIIGNPPFLGGRQLRLALGDDYVDRIVKHFPDVKDAVDFCSYWFRSAHDRIDENGRVGLVGTNSISQGLSRQAALDYIVENSGYIEDAIPTQAWSGEAKVHVSIVNWSKKIPSNFYLNYEIVTSINSSLTSTIDATNAFRLSANANTSYIGVQLTGKGFLVVENQVNLWIKSDDRNKEVLTLFSMGGNLAKNPHGRPDRWVIDFNDMTIEDASAYKLPFEYIKSNVKPERDNNRRDATRIYWWQYGEKRPGMRKAISRLSQYFTVPRVSKWATFIPASLEWLPGDLNVVISSDDFFILGILTSNVHRTWVKAQSSTLKGDTRYTPSTCFETFPFPQTPTQKQIDAIRTTALELHQYRSTQMEKKAWGITKLYNEYFHEPASQLAKLHTKLDTLTLQAYSFSPTDDLLEVLLALNLELAEKEKQGQAIIGPWAPDNPPKL
jgi:hypothetical protein